MRSELAHFIEIVCIAPKAQFYAADELDRKMEAIAAETEARIKELTRTEFETVLHAIETALRNSRKRNKKPRLVVSTSNTKSR